MKKIKVCKVKVLSNKINNSKRLSKSWKRIWGKWWITNAYKKSQVAQIWNKLLKLCRKFKKKLKFWSSDLKKKKLRSNLHIWKSKNLKNKYLQLGSKLYNTRSKHLYASKLTDACYSQSLNNQVARSVPNRKSHLCHISERCSNQVSPNPRFRGTNRRQMIISTNRLNTTHHSKDHCRKPSSVKCNRCNKFQPNLQLSFLNQPHL